jgi:thiamine biosynthesis protein ThiI
LRDELEPIEKSESGAPDPAPAGSVPELPPGARTYLVHYNEIGLKRGNRPFFERVLIQNIQHALRGLSVIAVRRLYGRLRVDQHERGDRQELERRLGRVHGVAHILPAERFGWDLDRVEAKLGEWAGEGGFASFAVRARRLEKSFPLRSHDLQVRLGALVGARSGARVDLESPERTFHLVVLNREIFLHHRRIDGPGGLPVGTAGRVLVMLSGGIDSPVAAERMMRRGCHIQFVHFHSSPFTDRSSVDKAIELAGILAADRMRTKLHLVPLGIVQRKIVAEAPAPWRVMLYRRTMLRIAARIAARERLAAIATGENLAQVASQTLENLAVLDRTVEIPVLRPLLAYDKIEIIAEAERIGTFETSIAPHSDCCGYLLPQRPVVAGTREEIEAIEGALDLEAEMAEVYARIEEVPIGGEE